MSNISGRQEAIHLFQAIETETSGLFALANLMTNVESSSLEDCTLNGLGHLLETIAVQLLTNSLDGLKTCRESDIP